MSPPVKIPLNANDKKKLRRRIAANYFAVVTVPGGYMGVLPALKYLRFFSHTITWCIAASALGILALFLFLVFFRVLRRLLRLKNDGHKFRERVSLKDAKVYANQLKGNSANVACFLEMPDKHTFVISYRQFVIAKELSDFFIEYQPYNNNHIDHVQSLDFNKEIEELQDQYPLPNADIVKRVKEALKRIRSRSDREPGQPGEPN